MLKTYVQHSARSSSSDTLHHGVLGLVTETGEIADILKKHTEYGQDLDIPNLREEMGDLMFYWAMICRVFSFNPDDILQENYDKLLKRYPSGFTNEHAKLRLDKELELHSMHKC